MKHLLETDKEVKVRQAALTVLKLLIKGLSQDALQVSMIMSCAHTHTQCQSYLLLNADSVSVCVHEHVCSCVHAFMYNAANLKEKFPLKHDIYN